MAKGWFKVPGIRPDGDRTLDEQKLGLHIALAEAPGKTVLDLGCAEALISREFAVAGANRVVGIELLQSHIDVGKQVCKGLPVTFICAHLGDYSVKNPTPEQYDIVLALGIIHKLHDPLIALRLAANSCKDLLCFRAPASKNAVGDKGDYIIRSKFSGMPCNVPHEMRQFGFVDEGTHNGVRGEVVQYWRRKRK